MKKIFLMLLALNSFTALGNPLGGNPTDGYCQTVDGSACGWGGGSSSSRRVYKVPNRWGAIYFNAANWAIGYSENNTEGEEAARREALANCIDSGGGKNPIARSGEGCHLMTEYRNACGAIALGGVKGSGRVSAHGGASIKEAEQKAINGCEKNQSFKCTVRYSGCSYHPDYRR
ncbi:hypothetical protein NEISICOT_01647 [Neisseria sicca ATCC 29256]|uniref:DUF4189 domain-containing protein n=2 Tax=Neisseria TaxID=482 RepID=C6M548_NEISI|nr:DUF4189 domain-containing protein [Neisseria sicca]EET44685.1 hypothetical protein NEISICOT_01647 [Neisseria sicca ATCC 29256]QMT38100.1 DUF4189 domain-containing protein [Neisseria sicca]